ncbi:MAG: hypothetical protein ACK4OP_13260, partial [Gemmobacter sp.]
ATLRSLEEFRDPDTGVIALPPDFGDLTGTGTRRVASANARLTLRDTAPLGFTLTAGISNTAYDNANPALIDATRINAGIAARLRLSPVTNATVGLRWSRFDPVIGVARETTGIDVGLSQEFPRGSLGISFAADLLPEGTRLGVTLSRNVEFPTAELSAAIGATRPAGSDGISVTGNLRYRQQFPLGSLTAEASSTVGTGADDTQRVITVLSLAYGQEIGPNSRIGLNASHTISTAVATGSEIATTSFGASYSHALTADWNLTLGLNHRIRNETAVGQAASSGVSLSLGRRWP